MTLARRLRTIAALAFPIMAGMISFNLMMLVDTGMVGRLGQTALAGVGQGAFLAAFVAACLMGIPSGVQAITARRSGEGQTARIAEGLNGGLVLALLVGLPVTLVGWMAAPRLLALLGAEPAVQSVATDYFRMLMFNNTPFGMMMTFESFFNGTARPRIVLRTMLASHVLNLLLDWLLIFGHWGFPALGAAGAGLATALAGLMATLAYALQAWQLARGQGYLSRWPDRATLHGIAALAWPVSLQNLFTSLGMLVFFALVSKVGTYATAVANVLLRLLDLLRLPASGIGVAAATLVGQSLGAGERERAWRWGWDTGLFALLVNTAVALPLWLAPAWLLGFFFQSSQEIAAAILPLRLVGLTGALAGTGLVLLSALLGAGDNRRVMAIATVLQWGFFLPAAYVVGVRAQAGLEAIMALQTLYGLLFTLCFATLWQRRAWQKIKL